MFCINLSGSYGQAQNSRTDLWGSCHTFLRIYASHLGMAKVTPIDRNESDLVSATAWITDLATVFSRRPL